MTLRCTLALAALFATSGSAQTAVSVKRTYYAPETGLVLVAPDGSVKRAAVSPGYLYFVADNNGGKDIAVLMATGICSQNHHASETPAQLADGRYILRARPNPARIAVYRGGVRLTPETHYQLIWLDKLQLPDRFEILPGAPGDGGAVVVDYFLGTDPEVLAGAK